MATFGERAEALLREPDVAPLADELVKRLASRLDPTDTDAGAEQIEGELNRALVSVVAARAVRHRWRLPDGG